MSWTRARIDSGAWERFDLRFASSYWILLLDRELPRLHHDSSRHRRQTTIHLRLIGSWQHGKEPELAHNVSLKGPFTGKNQGLLRLLHSPLSSLPRTSNIPDFCRLVKIRFR